MSDLLKLLLVIGRTLMERLCTVTTAIVPSKELAGSAEGNAPHQAKHFASGSFALSLASSKIKIEQAGEMIHRADKVKPHEGGWRVGLHRAVKQQRSFQLSIIGLTMACIKRHHKKWQINLNVIKGPHIPQTHNV